MPETLPLPEPYEDKLTDFQRLCLLRCFRVERIFFAIVRYIRGCMGEAYISPPIPTFESIFDGSLSSTPIVFILSPGSDPSRDLIKLAESTRFGVDRIQFLSMGQGQEKNVWDILQMASCRGMWLMLQNCHLVGWLVLLEKELERKLCILDDEVGIWCLIYYQCLCSDIVRCGILKTIYANPVYSTCLVRSLKRSAMCLGMKMIGIYRDFYPRLKNHEIKLRNSGR